MTTKQKSIGTRIKHLREEMGFTQSLLAEKLFVSDKTISKWETNRSIPDVDILVEMTEIFGVTLEYLLTGKKYQRVSKGGKVIYNSDGTVDYYLGEDGDRLFTRDEVSRILERRLNRYKKILFERFGATSEDELEVMIERYKSFESIMETSTKEAVERRRSRKRVHDYVNWLKRNNISQEEAKRRFDHFHDKGEMSDYEYNMICKLYLGDEYIYGKDKEGQKA